VVSDKLMNEENLGNHESEWVGELKTRHFFFWPTMDKMQTNFDFAEFNKQHVRPTSQKWSFVWILCILTL
jgi:hypothetical protein